MPGDPPPKADLHDSKTRGHECIAPRCRREQCSTTQQHQAHTHHRHNTDRKRATRDDGGPIQREPNSRQGRKHACVIESESQKATDDNWGCKTEDELAARSGKEGGVGTVRFGGGSGRRMATATKASISQTASHARGVVCREAASAATSAVIPIATPPQPGTAVNSAALSMVSRM